MQCLALFRPRRPLARHGLLLNACSIIAAGFIAGLPARADAIEDNEPLVMRLIFDDCLGYIRDGRTPFEGLATRPASTEAIGQLNSRMPDRQKAVELLSSRYVASWGMDAFARHCVIQTVWWAERDHLPGLLGVHVEGFIKRVHERAVAAGLTEAGLADEFSSVSISFWSEPKTGHDSGPLRPVSFTMLATTPTSERGIADAGLVVMGGPPQGKP